MTFLFQTGFCGSRGDVYLTTLTSWMKNPSPEGGHLPTESERLWRCEDANVLQLQRLDFFLFFKKWWEVVKWHFCEQEMPVLPVYII